MVLVVNYQKELNYIVKDFFFYVIKIYFKENT